MIFVFTGKLGGGKTLCTVGRVMEAFLANKPIATNLDLYPDKYFKQKKCTWTRLPDFPTAENLHALGRGNDTRDESKNGLLVLDECGALLNSREWQDKDRGDVFKWLVHSRKLGWDVILIVQDLQLLDKQIRMALAEITVICKRLDRIRIPLIGGLLQLAGAAGRLPRLHIATGRYGTDSHAPITDQWIFRGTPLYHAYDTTQVFSRHGTTANEIRTSQRVPELSKNPIIRFFQTFNHKPKPRSYKHGGKVS